jgi:hypothetical protein
LANGGARSVNLVTAAVVIERFVFPAIVKLNEPLAIVRIKSHGIEFPERAPPLAAYMAQLALPL